MYLLASDEKKNLASRLTVLLPIVSVRVLLHLKIYWGQMKNKKNKNKYKIANDAQIMVLILCNIAC